MLVGAYLWGTIFDMALKHISNCTKTSHLWEMCFVWPKMHFKTIIVHTYNTFPKKNSPHCAYNLIFETLNFGVDGKYDHLYSNDFLRPSFWLFSLIFKNKDGGLSYEEFVTLVITCNIKFLQ